MHFISSLTAIALVAFSAVAAPLETRQSTLAPWQLNSLGSFSPSGRPGQYPWLTITASLVDPNNLTLGTSPNDNSSVTVPSGSQVKNCQAKWLSSETPFGRSWPCDNSGDADGWWTLEVVQKDDFSSGNFDLVIKRVAEVLYQGSAYKKVYQAKAHFEVGDNMSGTCGGSGVCSWGLKKDLAPYDVQQEEVDDE